MRLLRRIPDAFTQFIDILIETKQNDKADLLLATNKTAILQGNNK